MTDCQETKPLIGGFEISTNTYSIAVAVPHLVAEYIGKATTTYQIMLHLHDFYDAYKAYETIALLETDEEDASYTTEQFGLGDGGDLAPVIGHHPLQGPKAFKSWDVKRTTVVTRDGQRWISFKDFQDRELLQISLVRKKEFLESSERTRADGNDRRNFDAMFDIMDAHWTIT